MESTSPAEVRGTGVAVDEPVPDLLTAGETRTSITRSAFCQMVGGEHA
jgi:hypothetical protein